MVTTPLYEKPPAIWKNSPAECLCPIDSCHRNGAVFCNIKPGYEPNVFEIEDVFTTVVCYNIIMFLIRYDDGTLPIMV